jgi:formate dehydrogenase subunit delta
MTTAAIVRMANQIGDNFGHLSGDEAAGALTTHLKMFWAPSLRAELVRYLKAGGKGLSPLVVIAAQRLPESGMLTIR